MTSEQFAYWLQGFSELHPEPPTPEQWQAIRDHLATVFVKVTPTQVSPNVWAPSRLQPLRAECLAEPLKTSTPMC